MLTPVGYFTTFEWGIGDIGWRLGKIGDNVYNYFVQKIAATRYFSV
jgi:hypothetical protein